jgi:hypothetical protein
MVTKAEAEEHIRYLATEWAKETGYVPAPRNYPSFSSFKSWLEAKHLSHYLNFRSRCGAEYDAEHWLEDVLKPRVW